MTAIVTARSAIAPSSSGESLLKLTAVQQFISVSNILSSSNSRWNIVVSRGRRHQYSTSCAGEIVQSGGCSLGGDL